MSTTEVIGFDDVKLIKPSDINPLYKAIENLREQSFCLEYNGDLNDKENIQAFINVQKDIKSFRATVKKSAKEFKKPYQEINKKIITIEKSLLADATKFFDENEAKFSDYRKKQEDINKERQAKKDALFNEKIELANKGRLEAEHKQKRSELYIKIKVAIYNLESISRDNAESRNLFYLTSYEEDLKELTFENYIGDDKDKELLGVELEKELRELFDSYVQKSLFAVQMGIRNKSKEVETQMLEATTKTIGTNEKKENYKDVTNDVLIAYIKSQVQELQYIVAERIALDPMTSPEIYSINSLLKTIIKTK